MEEAHNILMVILNKSIILNDQQHTMSQLNYNSSKNGFTNEKYIANFHMRPINCSNNIIFSRIRTNFFTVYISGAIRKI